MIVDLEDQKAKCLHWDNIWSICTTLRKNPICASELCKSLEIRATRWLWKVEFIVGLKTKTGWECLEEVPFPISSSLISAFVWTQGALDSKKPGDEKCVIIPKEVSSTWRGKPKELNEVFTIIREMFGDF